MEIVEWYHPMSEYRAPGTNIIPSQKHTSCKMIFLFQKVAYDMLVTSAPPFGISRSPWWWFQNLRDVDPT